MVKISNIGYCDVYSYDFCHKIFIGIPPKRVQRKILTGYLQEAPKLKEMIGQKLYKSRKYFKMQPVSHGSWKQVLGCSQSRNTQPCPQYWVPALPEASPEAAIFKSHSQLPLRTEQEQTIISCRALHPGAKCIGGHSWPYTENKDILLDS